MKTFRVITRTGDHMEHVKEYTVNARSAWDAKLAFCRKYTFEASLAREIEVQEYPNG